MLVNPALLLSTLRFYYTAEWLTILTPYLEAQGFEWSDDYGFVNYTTYKQISVYYNANYNVSIIQIWE